ncbi:MAG: hypothetical protein DA328_09985 [Nitrososphaeraceae archaeon]|nr:hypothetical protein [Nitrososphaeraceae archaeon]
MKNHLIREIDCKIVPNNKTGGQKIFLPTNWVGKKILIEGNELVVKNKILSVGFLRKKINDMVNVKLL